MKRAEGMKEGRESELRYQIDKGRMKWKKSGVFDPEMAVHLLYHGRQAGHGRQCLRQFALYRASVPPPCYCWCAEEEDSTPPRFSHFTCGVAGASSHCLHYQITICRVHYRVSSG